VLRLLKSLSDTVVDLAKTRPTKVFEAGFSEFSKCAKFHLLIPPVCMKR
jgi:hypothetical protein